MSTLKVSSLILILSILSCGGPNLEDNSQPITDQEVIEIIDYELKDSSIIRMPYKGKNKVVFVDSLSNNLVFTIQENELETNCMSNYNEELGKCEPPSWTIQSKEIMLFNDSLDLTFILELKTDLDRVGSGKKKFRDMLFLWTVSYPDNEEKDYTLFDNDKIRVSRRALFQCEVDRRNSEYESHWTPADSLLIQGRTFYNVFGQDSHGSQNDHSILFNFEFGILEFRDYENKYWRFSHSCN